MKVITITNRKGGIGKTITAQALYEGLKQKHYRVMGIDLDQQANFTDSVLYGKKPLFTIYDLLMETKPIDDAINEDLIGSNMKVAEKPTTEEKDINKFKKVLNTISPIYDYVVIDTPPSVNGFTIMALACSDYVILPSECDIYAITGLLEMNRQINKVKAEYENPSLKIKGILLTRYNPRTLITKELESLLNDVAKKLNTQLFKTRIRESVAVRESRALKQPLLTYNSGNSNAQRDYKAFIKEFLESEEK